MTAPNGERLARLEERMNTVEEGVANFREFQVDMRDWRTESRTIRAQDEKLSKRRAKLHYFWLGLLSALIVAGFTVMLTQFFALEKEHHITEAPAPISQTAAP